MVIRSMKTLLPALLALCLLSCSTPGILPAKPVSNAADEGRKKELASLIARVAFAKANADPAIHDSKGGGLVFYVYTVTQGAGGAPGYSVIIATDTSYAPAGDMALVCDTVEENSPHSLKCSGHVIVYQSRWLYICGDSTVVELGLGKHDIQMKIDGPQKTEVW